MTKTSSKLSILKLVYPPISSQEAVWLQNDAEVEKIMRQSDFYMIAGRAEAKFTNLAHDEKTLKISFTLEMGIHQVHGYLDIQKLEGVASADCESLYIETGEKMIRIWDGPLTEDTSNVLTWFTADKLLWDKWHCRPGINGMENYRDLTSFDLLYVGIAKQGDSYDRLVKNGHEARMKILSNEPQRYPGARVTDEILLFLFNVDPLIMNTFSLDHEFQEQDIEPKMEKKKIVADAEKAYVSLLKPDYNDIKFLQYPKGADGLYNSDYVRYGYVIGESIAFNTAHRTIKGGCDRFGFITNEADAIFVENDSVKLFIAGEDY